MSLQVEKLEHNMAKLTIEVSAEELEKALQGAYNKQKKNISIPGFRKGKVPRQMIEKMFSTMTLQISSFRKHTEKYMMKRILRSYRSQRLISYRLKKANHLFLQLRWH